MPSQNPSSFVLTVDEGRRNSGEAVWQEEGTGNDWQKLDALRLPGFDGRVHLSLSGFWSAALANRSVRFEQQIEGLETIMKFGNTQQLRTLYTVVLDATYEGPNDGSKDA